MEHRESEPVFVRSRVQPGRYVFNLRSKIGLALALLTVAGVGVALLVQKEKYRWSGAELREAAREAAEVLESKPQPALRHHDHAGAIEDAMAATDLGPAYRLAVGATSVPGAYLITADDTGTALCLRVAPADGTAEEDGRDGDDFGAPLRSTRVRAEVDDSPC
jgi:hypothetical protein